MRKLSSRSNQSSTFAIFGGSKMSLQKLSERQHDFNIFPKTRQDFTKKSQKFKVSKFSQNFRSHWHWHAQKITQTVSTTSILLECAKDVTFSEKC